jgi:hypothetical protein
LYFVKFCKCNFVVRLGRLINFLLQFRNLPSARFQHIFPPSVSWQALADKRRRMLIKLSHQSNGDDISSSQSSALTISFRRPQGIVRLRAEAIITLLSSPPPQLPRHPAASRNTPLCCLVRLFIIQLKIQSPALNFNRADLERCVHATLKVRHLYILAALSLLCVEL